nr:MAG TPA: hypothetical protein [Caudoviricetes sp.]
MNGTGTNRTEWKGTEMISIERDDQYGGYWVSGRDGVWYFDQSVGLGSVYDRFVGGEL